MAQTNLTEVSIMLKKNLSLILGGLWRVNYLVYAALTASLTQCELGALILVG
jgi:hypothetical protein